jgi:predicted nucleic acid-binding protein
VAYLFDTDALSEVLKPRPAPGYLSWLRGVAPEDQFTSAVCIGELFEGAFLSQHRDRHLRNITERVLPGVIVLPFDVESARMFGQVAAALKGKGEGLADPDVQIAATALAHDLDLVTGNIRHFARIDGLRLQPILATTRTR